MSASNEKYFNFFSPQYRSVKIKGIIVFFNFSFFWSLFFFLASNFFGIRSSMTLSWRYRVASQIWKLNSRRVVRIQSKNQSYRALKEVSRSYFISLAFPVVKSISKRFQRSVGQPAIILTIWMTVFLEKWEINIRCQITKTGCS